MNRFLVALSTAILLPASAQAATITLGVQHFTPGQTVTEAEFVTANQDESLEFNFYAFFSALSFDYHVPMTHADDVELTLGVIGDVSLILAGNPLPGDIVDVTSLFDLTGDPSVYRLLTATIPASAFPVYLAGFHGGMAFNGEGGLDFMRLVGPWAADYDSSVPEPATLSMLLVGVSGILTRRWLKRSRT